MRRAASSLVAGLVGTWLPGGWPGGMAQELDRAVARAQDAGRGEAVLFVSPDDNDAHPGTQAEPFATITKARDPLFIDADANDYRYAPGSPALRMFWRSRPRMHTVCSGICSRRPPIAGDSDLATSHRSRWSPSTPASERSLTVYLYIDHQAPDARCWVDDFFIGKYP